MSPRWPLIFHHPQGNPKLKKKNFWIKLGTSFRSSFSMIHQQQSSRTGCFPRPPDSVPQSCAWLDGYNLQCRFFETNPDEVHPSTNSSWSLHSQLSIKTLFKPFGVQLTEVRWPAGWSQRSHLPKLFGLDLTIHLWSFHVAIDIETPVQ